MMRNVWRNEDSMARANTPLFIPTEDYTLSIENENLMFPAVRVMC